MPLALLGVSVAAIVLGVALVSVPAAFIVGGVIGSVAALYVDFTSLRKGGSK